jgi:hypothetical protein
MSSRYSNLSLNMALHHELVETFFHQLLRRLIKDDSFRRFIDSEQLIQALFMLFHVEAAAKSRFTGDFNHDLTALHGRIQELLDDKPELMTESASSSQEEEAA